MKQKTSVLLKTNMKTPGQHTTLPEPIKKKKLANMTTDELEKLLEHLESQNQGHSARASQARAALKTKLSELAARATRAPGKIFST